MVRGRARGAGAGAGAPPNPPERAAVRAMLARLEANCFGVTDAILVVRASGLYPRGALLQHSCDHNCVLAYDGATRRVTVRALRAVAAGDELTHACVSPGARDKI